MNPNNLKKLAQVTGRHGLVFGKWMLIACLTGLVVGAFSSLFARCMIWATGTFTDKGTVTAWFLPVAGLMIVFLYRVSGMGQDKGTNRIIQSAGGEERVPLRLAPLIFVSTVLTHVCGGSAGREGAALQIGGSLGDNIARLFRMDMDDRRVLVMCGMGAAFSAVFGTPMAAALFPLEMVTVGMMYYSALVPCVVSSFVASQFAGGMGIHPETFVVKDIPSIAVDSVGKIVVVGIGCALVAILFCLMMRLMARWLTRWLPNAYVRVAVAGVVVAGVSWLLGTQDYMGAGIAGIEQAINGQTAPEAFLLKILFTAVTLASGYKGGEIVPSFFVGATFGCFMGQMLGLSPSLCAAVGMVSVFCGVTNCPVTSMFIAFELFGMGGSLYFLLSVALSYMLSGHSSLYGNQTLAFAKFPFEQTPMTARADALFSRYHHQK
ncbi:MAG: chloride channel protein [Acutalibacteraceae bacterium]